MLSQSSHETLLLVDDERAIIDTLFEFLTELGFIVKTAGNGAEALEILRTETIDVVLSDIQMPVMDGLELLARLRTADSEVPFVFFTGFGEKKNIVEALRLGATDFLDKPFNKTTFMDVLTKALEYGRTLKQIETQTQQLYADSELSEERIIRLRKMKRAVMAMRPYAKIYMSDDPCG